MKKTISFILSIVMVLSVLSVCGGISAFAAEYDTTAITTTGEQVRLYVPKLNASTGAEEHHAVSADATTSFGQKFTVGEGLYLTNIALSLMTISDGDHPTDGVLKIYQWDTDYATTKASAPIFTEYFYDVTKDTPFFSVGVYGEITGELYYEITSVEEGYYFKPFYSFTGDVEQAVSFVNGSTFNSFGDENLDEIYGKITLSATPTPNPYNTTKITTVGDTYLHYIPNNDDGTPNLNHHDGVQHWGVKATNKTFGQKFTVAEDKAVTKIKIRHTTNDGDGTLKVYRWKGNYTDTVKGTPLYTANITGHLNNDPIEASVPALNGELYYEVTYTTDDEGAFTPFNTKGDSEYAVSFASGNIFPENVEIVGIVTVGEIATKEITTTGTVDLGGVDGTHNLDLVGKFPKVGQKFTLADGLTVGGISMTICTPGDGDATMRLTIYKWNTDYATTTGENKVVLYTNEFIAKSYTLTHELDSSKVQGILSGDLYWEVEFVESLVPDATETGFNVQKTEIGSKKDGTGEEFKGEYSASFVNGDLTPTSDISASITVTEDTPRIEAAQISLGEDISLNVYAVGSKIDFTMNGTTTTVDIVDSKATLKGITPQCMTDEIKVELKDSTGAVKVTKTTTVKEILETTKAVDESTATIVDALINYGAAAQVYRNYNASGVTVAEEGLKTPDAANVMKNNGIVGLVTAGVRFDYKNKVYFVLASKVDGVTIAVDDGKAVAVTGEAYGTNYIYYSEGINATQFDSTVTITVGDATATYSVNDFAYNMADSEDAATAALVKALYTYGLAAEDYAAN